MSIAGMGPSSAIDSVVSNIRTQSASNLASAKFGVMEAGAAHEAALAAIKGFGGAAAAVSSLRSAGSAGFGGTANSGGEIGQVTGDIASQNKANLGAAASENAQAQSFQVDMFRLQNAINTQSQTNNMISNMQKARHDALMATIQNTR